MAMDFKAVADLEDPVTACKVIIAGLAPLSDLNLVTYGAHPTGMVAADTPRLRPCSLWARDASCMHGTVLALSVSRQIFFTQGYWDSR